MINENLLISIPYRYMKIYGKMYLNKFRKNAIKHIQKQNTVGVLPFDWEIKYRELGKSKFEICVLSCGICELSKTYDVQGILPGICRMDYLFSKYMHNGFERDKTIGNGDSICNCRYDINGESDWNPQKGFDSRK